MICGGVGDQIKGLASIFQKSVDLKMCFSINWNRFVNVYPSILRSRGDTNVLAGFISDYTSEKQITIRHHSSYIDGKNIDSCSWGAKWKSTGESGAFIHFNGEVSSLKFDTFSLIKLLVHCKKIISVDVFLSNSHSHMWNFQLSSSYDGITIMSATSFKM
jgi:hypothetical protein